MLRLFCLYNFREMQLRAAIFIDGGYLLNKAKFHKVNPDFRKLTEFLLEPLRAKFPLDLLRCYFYYCPPWMSSDPTDSENRRMEAYKTFEDEINNLDRWELRLGKLQKRSDGARDYFEQKRVDVLLSCDMVRHAAAGHIQHAILLAGDSDFIPAVDATKESGVTVTLWCAEANTVHEELIDLCDEVYRFDWEKIPQSSSGVVYDPAHITPSEKRRTGGGPQQSNRPQPSSSQGSGQRSGGSRPPRSSGNGNTQAGGDEERSGPGPSKNRPRRRRGGAGRPKPQPVTEAPKKTIKESITSRLKRLTKKIAKE